MSIIIGADLVPTKTNAELFSMGEAVELVGEELYSLINEAELSVFNLETPLADTPTPIKKSGPNLIAPTDTAKGYKSLGVKLLTLANNHILDQGEEGLRSTVAALDKCDVEYFGAGDTLDAASKPYEHVIGGKRFGIYACVEHEFSTVTEGTAGANPYDPLESFDAVQTLRKTCDYVIVLYHGGKEYLRYPSPELQRICRKFVDKGADLVICQHSHCVGCEEKYNGGTVVYGQGNFLFDYSDNECWMTGVLVELDDGLNVSYIPIEKKKNKVRLAKGKRAERILDGFNTRSEEIKTEGFVRAKYTEFAEEKYYGYLQAMSGISKFGIMFRAINKITRGNHLKRFLDKRYSAKNLLTLQNIIECEAHRELLLEALKQKNK